MKKSMLLILSIAVLLVSAVSLSGRSGCDGALGALIPCSPASPVDLPENAPIPPVVVTDEVPPPPTEVLPTSVPPTLVPPGAGTALPPIDSDADGVSDANDQCPTQPGSSTNNGCPAGSSAATAVPGVPTVAPTRVPPFVFPASADCLVAPYAQTINVRSGPGVTYEVVDVLRPGAYVNAALLWFNDEGEGWYSTTVGWIATRAVQVSRNCGLEPVVTIFPSARTVFLPDAVFAADSSSTSSDTDECPWRVVIDGVPSCALPETSTAIGTLPTGDPTTARGEHILLARQFGSASLCPEAVFTDRILPDAPAENQLLGLIVQEVSALPEIDSICTIELMVSAFNDGIAQIFAVEGGWLAVMDVLRITAIDVDNLPVVNVSADASGAFGQLCVIRRDGASVCTTVPD